jgi:hypothetical protein
MPFSCEICQYHTNRKDNFYRHIGSKSHKEKYKLNPSPLLNQKLEKEKKYVCKRCEKRFSYLSGLSRHKKICKDVSEEKIINILKTHSVALYEFRTENSTITPLFLSETFKDLYGLEPNTIEKNWKIIFSLIHPDDLDNVKKNVHNFLNTENPVFGEHRVIIDGKIKWIWTQSYPTKQEDGSVLWRGKDTDITAFKLSSQAKSPTPFTKPASTR